MTTNYNNRKIKYSKKIPSNTVEAHAIPIFHINQMQYNGQPQ